MSKIICDICGTSYAETAKQCPICGSVRPGDVQRMTNEVKSDGSGSTGYTYVKGGRFSKGNVKKRNNTPAKRPEKPASEPKKNNNNRKPNPSGEKDNRALVITAIVLLLAVIGVVIFVAMKFIAPISDPDDGTVATEQIACTNIELSVPNLNFDKTDATQLLSVTKEPANTTDTVKFESKDPKVVTVNSDGLVTVVGEGTTNIVITCGNVTKMCPVTVKFETSGGSENTENPGNTENPDNPDNPEKPEGTIRLNRKDMTLSQKGATWNLYSGDIAKNLVTFTSDDETVVTFVDGVVTAVSPNYDGVWVHAEYEGQKVSCLVRCSFKENSGVTGNGGVSEDGGNAGTMGTVMDGINVRSGPGLSFGTIGTLLSGDRVSVTERQQADGHEWGKITYGNGTGWIALTYVKLDTP